MVDSDSVKDGGEEVAVCLKCLEPVDGTSDFCPHCGAGANELTSCMPYLEMYEKGGSIVGNCFKGVRGLIGRLFGGGGDGDVS